MHLRQSEDRRSLHCSMTRQRFVYAAAGEEFTAGVNHLETPKSQGKSSHRFRPGPTPLAFASMIRRASVRAFRGISGHEHVVEVAHNATSRAI